jgi:hypothetical protein
MLVLDSDTKTETAKDAKAGAKDHTERSLPQGLFQHSVNHKKESIMFKRLASGVIITALVCTLGGTTAFANTTCNADDATNPPAISSEAPSKEVERNERVKNNILKLVADAKAGKVAPVAKSQIQPARSNNLSTKTKVAIGVGVAAVVLFLVVNHVRNHLFDDFHPFRQGGN